MNKNKELTSNHVRLKTVQFSSPQELELNKNSSERVHNGTKSLSDVYETSIMAEELRKTKLLMEKLKLRYYHIAAQVPKIRPKSQLSDQKKTLNLFFNPSLLDKKLFEAKKNFSHKGLTKVFFFFLTKKSMDVIISLY